MASMQSSEVLWSLPDGQHAGRELLQGRVGTGVQAEADMHAVWLSHLGRSYILAIQTHEGKQEIVQHCARHEGSTQTPQPLCPRRTCVMTSRTGILRTCTT